MLSRIAAPEFHLRRQTTFEMKPFFVLLALLLGGSAHAEQLYLLFESDCGNRIEYARTVADRPQMDYLAYSFPLPGGSTLVLETDTEGLVYRSDLPTDYLQCGGGLDAALAERINGGTLQVFLLTPDGAGQYAQQPVMMASTITQRGSRVDYASPLAAFAFGTDNAIIGENLDRGGEGATVYFDGREGSDCSSAFLFQQQHPNSAYPTINYKLLPQVGILEREMLGAGNYSGGDLITARSINGQPIADYLSALCQTDQQPTYTEGQQSFVPYYEEGPQEQYTTSVVSQETLPYEAPPAPAAPAPVTTTVAPAPQFPAPVDGGTVGPTHRVASGETLYGIARRYGLSVDLLKQYNGLGGNTIYVGQELLTGPAVAPLAPAMVVSAPRPEATRLVSGEPAQLEKQDVHIVQAGETVASIALRYGYTTQRFREFNGLAGQAVAKVGQSLRTSHCECPTGNSISTVSDTYLLAQTDRPAPTGYTNSGVIDYGSQTEVPVYQQGPQPSVQIVVPPMRPLNGPETNLPPAYPQQTYEGSPQAPQEVGTTASFPAESRPVHIVREGDNLFAIARRYGTTVAELRSLNQLMPADVIVPHQTLYLN